MATSTQIEKAVKRQTKALRQALASGFNEDARFALEYGQRDYRNAVAGAAWERLLPALMDLQARLKASGATAPANPIVDDSGITAYVTEDGLVMGPAPDGAMFQVEFSVETKPDQVVRTVSLDRIGPSEPDKEYPPFVCSGHLMEYKGRAMRSGNLHQDEVDAFFAFMDLQRRLGASVAPATENYVLPMVDAELDADGGIPGECAKAVLAAMEDIGLKAVLTWAATEVPAFSGLMRQQGLTWGEAYLAYNDTDVRCCAVVVPGGTAVFHQNIDLISDFYGFVAVAEAGGDGRTSQVRVHMVSRERDDIPAVAEALMRGESPPGTATASFDLETGVLAKSEGFDRTNLQHTLYFGLKYDREAVEKLAAGKKGSLGTEVRKDFSGFERGWDPEVEDGGAPGP